MFKYLRKIAVMLAFAAILVASVLGTTTVAQTVTGHTPTAHADGSGGAQLNIFCDIQDGWPSASWYPATVYVYGENQYGQWVPWWGSTTFHATVEGNYSQAFTGGYWWVGTVYVTIWDNDGTARDYETPVWIQPWTYGYWTEWSC